MSDFLSKLILTPELFVPGQHPRFSNLYELDRGAASGQGLVGWWLINEGRGVTVQNIYNKKDGELKGFLPLSEWVGGRDGFGYAVNMDGFNNHILVPSSDYQFPSGTQDFSAFMWVKRGISGTNQALLSVQDGDDDGWNLRLVSNALWCQLNHIDVKSTSTIPVGSWQHLGVVIDRSGNGQIYINGKPDGPPVAISGEAMSTSSDLYIGTLSYTASDFFDGLIGEVQIYERAISPDEAKKAYLGAVPLRPVLPWLGIPVSAPAGIPIYLGSNQVQSVYKGSSAVSEIYKGSTRIWP